MKNEVIKSFNRIALLEDKWDHNRRYSKVLLKEMGSSMECVLDIGCGTGEFTRKVANIARKVVGIDIAPQMIAEAKKRHGAPNIEYIEQDFDTMEIQGKYDCIVSIATFHHLRMEAALPKIKSALRPGGKLVVLDLYQRHGIYDFLLDMIAVPANVIMKRVKNGQFRPDREEMEAWKEHMILDHYTPLKELRKVYQQHLDANIEIRRLVFWRYIAIYRKDSNHEH